MLPGQALVADTTIFNNCDLLRCLMTVSQCYKWELVTWIPSVSRHTNIQDAEILGQVEGRQSKGSVCGPPLPCAANELSFSSVL